MNPVIINAIPLPAVVISMDDAITHLNLAFENVFPSVRIGRSYLSVLRHPNLVKLIDSLRAGLPADAVEMTVKGQTEGSFRATGANLDEHHVLICLQDMNETANAIQIRKDFVADLSHELKTPLTAISGILETCEDDTEALAHFLPVMSGEVSRMKRLVADLLTLSRVEGNERRSPTQQVSLQKAVKDACDPLAVLADQVGIRIETVLPDAQINFQGDGDEITRAISNLVENGIRYGNSGGVVTVSGRINVAGSGRSSFTIDVSDDGPGIASHHIPRLTERFYRVDAHRSRDSGGSGLGLAIVKHIVTHHRGRMAIDSTPGKGLRVSLTLSLDQIGS